MSFNKSEQIPQKGIMILNENGENEPFSSVCQEPERWNNWKNSSLHENDENDKISLLVCENKSESYSVKKTVFWIPREATSPDLAVWNNVILERVGVKSDDKSSVDHVLKVKEVAVISPQYRDPLTGEYTAFLYSEKVRPIDSFEDPIDICIKLCDILEKFYSESNNQMHNNINHLNIYTDGKNLILGNPSLEGVKNELVYYSSPEVMTGLKPTKSSDVYSLGVLLYHMLRMNKDTPSIFLQKDCFSIKKEDIVVASDEITNVIRTAVACDTKERYNSPSELKKALEEIRKNTSKKKKSANPNLWKYLCAVVASVIIFAVAGYSIRSYDPGAKEIQSMISSGSYSLAYEEISSRDRNEKTDELIVEYINGCLDVLDYQRAAQIIPLFSDKMFDSPDFIEELIYTYSKKGKMDILYPILSRLYSKSDAMAQLVNDIG